MLFTSIEFAIFLPIVFLLYWFVFQKNLKLQNFFIVLASYIFYGWWDWRFLILIAFTSICSWGAGLLIDKFKDSGKKAKLINVVNICINLLILGVFKYYNFFVNSFVPLFGGSTDGLLIKIILPVGISFYTFQALSYSIDVYRGKICPTRDLIQFLAFVSFFPQLVAGPIERATNLLPQFGRRREFNYENAVDGARQMLWGFFKKIAVADQCAILVDNVFGSYQTQHPSVLMLGGLLFTFQIYGDFSGYSDIAIGTSKLFGIKLMRNFNVPFFSRDIAEFWRRWHISLTTWFRDYIYIPLGGSRCSKWKVVRNTFVIFLVSGLWHGANWTFVCWGAYHAILFLPLILLGKNRKYTDVAASDRLLPNFKEVLQMTFTFFLCLIGWIIFRAEDMPQAIEYLGRMANISVLRAVPRFFSSAFVPTKVVVFSLVMIVVEWIQRRKEHPLEISCIKRKFPRIAIYWCLLTMMILSTGGNQAFIYFQF